MPQHIHHHYPIAGTGFCVAKNAVQAHPSSGIAPSPGVHPTKIRSAAGELLAKRGFPRVRMTSIQVPHNAGAEVVTCGCKRGLAHSLAGNSSLRKIQAWVAVTCTQLQDSPATSVVSMTGTSLGQARFSPYEPKAGVKATSQLRIVTGGLPKACVIVL